MNPFEAEDGAASLYNKSGCSHGFFWARRGAERSGGPALAHPAKPLRHRPPIRPHDSFGSSWLIPPASAAHPVVDSGSTRPLLREAIGKKATAPSSLRFAGALHTQSTRAFVLECGAQHRFRSVLSVPFGLLACEQGGAPGCGACKPTLNSTAHRPRRPARESLARHPRRWAPLFRVPNDRFIYFRLRGPVQTPATAAGKPRAGVSRATSARGNFVCTFRQSNSGS